MSEEKVLTLRGKKAVWAPGGGSGPIDPSRLPEGYPYKEQSVQHITWDGNTEGLDNLGGNVFKVSDAVLTASNLIGQRFLFVSHQEEPIADAIITAEMIKEELGGIVVYYMLDGGSYDMPMVVSLPAEYNGVPAGTYFFCQTNPGLHVSYLSYISETIHPMAPEFLPALTSPNGTKYQLTVADDGTLSAVAVS